MDATQEAVSRLYAQGYSIRETARRADCSGQKARKILITLGQYSSPKVAEANRLKESGASVEDIARALKITPKSVNALLPYERCMYNAEYPTINAMRVRQCKARKARKDTLP